MKFYLYNKNRYFTGSRDFPEGITPTNGTTTPPNNDTNQKWMGNEWKNVPLPTPSLDELKLRKIKKCTDFYQDIITQAYNDIAEFEKSTWEVQRQEWASYIQDPLNNTPYIDQLATSRGILRDDLMTKVGLKVLFGANIQGQMQAKIDQIKAAVDNVELEAVTFEVV